MLIQVMSNSKYSSIKETLTDRLTIVLLGSFIILCAVHIAIVVRDESDARIFNNTITSLNSTITTLKGNLESSENEIEKLSKAMGLLPRELINEIQKLKPTGNRIEFELEKKKSIKKFMHYISALLKTHKIDLKLPPLGEDGEPLIPAMEIDFTKGLDYIMQNSESLPIYRKAKVADPLAETHYTNALEAANSGDFAKAARLIDKIKNAKEFPEVCIVGAYAYAKDSKPDKAKELLERALELEPELPYVNWRAGEIFIQLGDLGNASLHFEKALDRIELSNNEPLHASEMDPLKSSYYHLGSIYLDAGINKRACDMLRKFSNLHKVDDEVAEYVIKVLSDCK